MGELTVHTGTWMPEDRFASPWHYLPVEVAPGTAALRVALEYDRAAAVLDLGCLGPSGFRGWSGGARESFLIGAEAATPGYLPGEVEAGLWAVVARPARGAAGRRPLPGHGRAGHRDGGRLPRPGGRERSSGAGQQACPAGAAREAGISLAGGRPARAHPA